MRRKSKSQIELERAQKDQQRIEKARARKAKLEQQRKEAAQREWLRKERSRPRVELPSEYAGESIHVHKRILDSFMKQAGKKLNIDTFKAVGGIGGKLVIEYTTRYGGRGKLELNDLGPMPIH